MNPLLATVRAGKRGEPLPPLPEGMDDATWRYHYLMARHEAGLECKWDVVFPQNDKVDNLFDLAPLDFQKPEGESVFRIFRLMAYDEGREGRPIGTCPACMSEHYLEAYKEGRIRFRVG